MKRLKFVGLAMILLLVLVIVVPSTAYNPELASTKIVFDGYCDGMLVYIPARGTGNRDTLDGRRTGCATDPLMGTRKGNFNTNGELIISFFADGALTLHTVIRANGTWTHYALSGDQMYVLNAGTWSYDTGYPIRGGVSSTASR